MARHSSDVLDAIYMPDCVSGPQTPIAGENTASVLRMYGGIDKRVLRDGMSRKAIEEEVAKKEDLIKDGGYSPTVDHAIPPDVPFDNFKFYLGLLHEVCAGR